MHRAGRPLIPGGFRRPARWRGATCSGAQRGTLMSVDSFDTGDLPADLAATLARLEPRALLPPELAAKLDEFAARMQPSPELMASLDALRRERRKEAHEFARSWVRDLDRRERLDAALVELAAERRQRASGGGAQPPASGAAPPALPVAPAPAPAVQAAPLGADGWPSAEWIAERVEAIQHEQPRNRAWTATLLEMIGKPNTVATRRRVQRACKAVARAKVAAAAAASEPPKAPAWPAYTRPEKRAA